MTETRPRGVYAAVGVGLLTFSFSPILVRYATDAPGLTVAAFRTCFAVLLLAPVAIRNGLESVRRFSRRDWALIILSGVFLAGHFIAWIESLYLTSVASASILVASSPVVLAALGFIFLRERLPLPVLISIVAGVGGAIVMSVGDSGAVGAAPAPLLGNALAALATLLFSAYFVIGRVVRQRVDWIAFVFPVYATVAVVTLGAALVRGVPLLGHAPIVYLLCLAMAVGPQIIGHGSFSYAVRYFSATMLGLLGLTEPLGASVFAYFLFGESPTTLSIVGMVIVLAAVASALVFSRIRRPPIPT